MIADLNDFFGRIAPEDNRLYRHTIEGPDDMPAHIRAALTATQLSIPVIDGRMALGTWQGFYVFEHRRPGAAVASLYMRSANSLRKRRRRYRWMRAEPPFAKARTCSTVAMVVSPGNVVSSAPCAQPSFTASCGDSPVSRP